MPLPNHPAVNGFTGFLLRKVSLASFEGFSKVTGEEGLHPMHFGMLAILDADGPISQRDLSLRTGVDPSTMVARMDVLADKGLVERERSTTDRRSYELRLTDEGRAVLGRLREAAAAQGEAIFGVLEPEERAQLHRLLTKLAERVDESGRA